MAGGVALFLSLALGAQILAGQKDRPTSPGFGLDFIAFYTGGTFINEGRHRELFDLRAVKHFEHDLGLKHGVDLGDAFGPWWNPPFYAWVFSPLARLPYPTAIGVWITINLFCAACAAWLLVRMLPRGLHWTVWGLVPVGIALSVPFLQSLTHGQNTGMSLLILTVTVAAWRSGRGVLAGMAGGLMFYKPQHAAILSAVMVVSLGWRAVVGLGITGSFLLAVTLFTLPGSLGDFLHRLPANVHFVQVDLVYPWERHATFKAFWRLLLQGRDKGEMGLLGVTMTAICTAGVGVGLIRVSPLWRIFADPFAKKPDADSRDGLIAATIAATPVLMPFYFDYDLALLAIPAVLFANQCLARPADVMPGRADRWLMVVWPALFGWMLINADIAEQYRLNLAVPLAAAVASLTIARAMPRRETIAVARPQAHRPAARAA